MSSLRQKMVQGQVNELVAKLLIDGDPTTLTSATCEIFSAGGSSLATPSVTVSTHIATVSQSWPEATYPRGYHYRADFVLNYSGGSKKLTVYFDVVKRRFESSVVDQDILDLIPALKIPSASQDLSKFRDAAWRYIERRLINRLPKGVVIEDVAKPEDFFDAHVNGTIWKVFEARAFSGNGTFNWDSAEKYKVYTEDAINAVMNRMFLDDDQDMLISEDDDDYNLSNFRLVR